jgi:hypothetical protein
VTRRPRRSPSEQRPTRSGRARRRRPRRAPRAAGGPDANVERIARVECPNTAMPSALRVDPRRPLQLPRLCPPGRLRADVSRNFARASRSGCPRPGRRHHPMERATFARPGDFAPRWPPAARSSGAADRRCAPCSPTCGRADLPPECSTRPGHRRGGRKAASSPPASAISFTGSLTARHIGVAAARTSSRSAELGGSCSIVFADADIEAAAKKRRLAVHEPAGRSAAGRPLWSSRSSSRSRGSTAIPTRTSRRLARSGHHRQPAHPP